MLDRFGALHSLLGLRRMLARLRLGDHSASRVRGAADRGPLVYVMLRCSHIDYLALNTVLVAHGLPLPMWGNGVTSTPWMPLAAMWRHLRDGLSYRLREGMLPDPVRSGWLADAVLGGATVAVFVQRRRRLGDVVIAPEEDPLEALLQAQQASDRPIQLVPTVLVWDRAPEVSRSAVRHFLMGNREAPGGLARLANLVLRGRNALVQMGDPIDLAEFSSRVNSPRQLRALRILLRRYLRRESEVIRGPRLLPKATLRRMVLDNPPMRDLAQREAEAKGRPLRRVERDMQKDFDTIAANFSWPVIRVLYLLLQPLWTKVFSGVDIREEDLERIRAANRAGTAILIPCHKSHFDYLMLSWLLYEKDMIVPHIVAGVNLAIWPLSYVLRGAGAFFILRKFGDNRVFPQVFARYLRELVRHGYPVEFFIEGGRTRSGKLLNPRLGVLGMVLDAAEHRRPGQEVTLLPIAMAYEKVAEEQSYARELSGADKAPESLGQLVQARSVLRRRFGKVYVRVGEPIAASTILEGPEPWHARSRLERTEELARVGQHVVFNIGQAMVVLPTSLVALALLAHHRRGIRHRELLDRINRFRGFLRDAGAVEAASLSRPSHAVHQALHRLLRYRVAGRSRPLVQCLDDRGEPVWAPVVEHRITLEFYKNQVLHYFATAGLAAAAVRALPEGRFETSDPHSAFVYLVWLLRKEFVLDPTRSATALLKEGLDRLASYGALSRDDGGWRVEDPVRIGEIYGLFRNLLEAYAHVLRVSPASEGRPAKSRDLAKAVQSTTDLARDGITRPEALSLVTLTNAFDAALGEGTLAPDDRGRLQIHAERRQHHLSMLAPMVDG